MCSLFQKDCISDYRTAGFGNDPSLPKSIRNGYKQFEETGYLYKIIETKYCPCLLATSDKYVPPTPGKYCILSLECISHGLKSQLWRNNFYGKWS